MSSTGTVKPITAIDIRKKKGDVPIVCLTAYTSPMADIADEFCDLLLVGDSVGMVLHGLPSTLEVTMDMMIMHARAVRRGTKHALLVVDMPFGTYEVSPQQAFENAFKIIAETGCDAVKVEGGRKMSETISFLSERGIPVMAHIGLTPQSVNTFGGYGVQGRGESRNSILEDAQAVAKAGAFCVVLEKIPETLAVEITNLIDIPTIGIGASKSCDGQILVTEDMLGLFTAFTPKFVKKYAEIAITSRAAIQNYASDVRDRKFPGNEHVYEDIAL